jgi:hypothetical protein
MRARTPKLPFVTKIHRSGCAEPADRAIVKRVAFAEIERMPRKTSALRWGALLAAAGLLAGCGYLGSSSPNKAAHAPPGPKAHARTAPVDPAARALAGMVEAVGPSGAQPPVDLRFSIRDRPEVGQDDEIDYAIIPQVPGLENIRLVFGSLDGLEVVSHGPALAAVKPAAGVPIFGSVTVRPVKAGLFTLTAAVGVESPAQSVVWPFSIPVIAGEGPAQTAANKP